MKMPQTPQTQRRRPPPFRLRTSATATVPRCDASTSLQGSPPGSSSSSSDMDSPGSPSSPWPLQLDSADASNERRRLSIFRFDFSRKLHSQDDTNRSTTPESATAAPPLPITTLPDLPLDLILAIAVLLHPHDANKLSLLTRSLHASLPQPLRSYSFALTSLSQWPRPSPHRLAWARLGPAWVAALLTRKGFRRATLAWLHGRSGWCAALARDRSARTTEAGAALEAGVRLLVAMGRFGRAEAMAENAMALRWAAATDRVGLMGVLLRVAGCDAGPTTLVAMFRAAVHGGAASAVAAFLDPDRAFPRTSHGATMLRTAFSVDRRDPMGQLGFFEDGDAPPPRKEFRAMAVAARNGDMEVMKVLVGAAARRWKGVGGGGWREMDGVFLSACDRGRDEVVGYLLSLRGGPAMARLEVHRLPVERGVEVAARAGHESTARVVLERVEAGARLGVLERVCGGLVARRTASRAAVGVVEELVATALGEEGGMGRKEAREMVGRLVWTAVRAGRVRVAVRLARKMSATWSLGGGSTTGAARRVEELENHEK
ncbi:hypothetical protein HDU96_007382 [Phlyctochytrium bullatum]|nr:hypothetical protein HDU96_007382 [Phlyctochytrium bullatum]